eukprot:9110726-Pyramimonas_sp.AAC.1
MAPMHPLRRTPHAFRGPTWSSTEGGAHNCGSIHNCKLLGLLQEYGFQTLPIHAEEVVMFHVGIRSS